MGVDSHFLKAAPGLFGQHEGQRPSEHGHPGGWSVDPAHGPRRTVLDDLPTPTDQKLRARRVLERAEAVQHQSAATRPTCA
jgi:hypothetical protein